MLLLFGFLAMLYIEIIRIDFYNRSCFSYYVRYNKKRYFSLSKSTHTLLFFVFPTRAYSLSRYSHSYRNELS